MKHWLLALLVLLLAVSLAAQPRPALDTVPRPALDALEAPARLQVEQQQAALDAALGKPDLPAPELARAFGELGQLYLLYDLPEPAAACFANAGRLVPADVRPHYYAAVALGETGRFDEAAASLERALALAPDDVPALVRLGNVRFEQNRLDEAERAFQRALELGGAPAAARYGLGRIAAARRDDAAARDHFEAVLGLQPWASAVHHPLAMAYRGLGDLEKAKAHLAESGKEPVAFRDPLVESLARLNKSARLHVSRGNDARRKGFTTLAIEEYRAALAIEPGNATTRYNLGTVLAAAGDAAGAVAELRAALAIEPGHADARYNLATALGAAGRFAEAAAEYALLLERRPDDVGARLQRGMALAELGRHEEAVAEIEVARRRATPADAERLRLTEALAAARFGLGGFLGRAGRYREAAAAFAAVVAERPDHAPAHLGRANALLLAGDCAAARAALDEGTTAVPADKALEDALARVLSNCPDG